MDIIKKEKKEYKIKSTDRLGVDYEYQYAIETVKPKFQLGKHVWIMVNNKPVRPVVASVIITVEKWGMIMNEHRIFYELQNYSCHSKNSEKGCFPEDELFSTKEELIKSL